jgi:hypothetical protein
VKPRIEADADRRWDRGWHQDWDKLEKLQERDEPIKTVPPTPPRGKVLEKIRDEDMAAAENAHKELVAERERALRKAERKEQKQPKPQEDAQD